MASITARELYINSVKMPTPAQGGINITRNKIWSANTGRTDTGKMVGTLVAIKTKLAIKWPPVTEEQAALIEAAVSGDAFVPVRFVDMTGAEQTYSMYFGDPTYTQYSWADGLRHITGISVDGIEQ